MNETTQQIQKLQSIIAGCKRELQVLDTRGRNSISIIRSELDLLNLDDDEDLTNLNIESAIVEMNELTGTIDQMKQKKEKLERAEKELKQIKKALG
ncbi:MAG: hypothetical protein Kow0098_03570 [Ignavibacteriaceae bacterium]